MQRESEKISTLDHIFTRYYPIWKVISLALQKTCSKTDH